MQYNELEKMQSKNYKYIIVTPCKNEEVNISKLIESIASQTIRPVLWVIIDDGSTDRTPDIIADAIYQHSWIQSIKFNYERRDRGLHLANIIREGFDYGTDYCKTRQIEYDYLSNIDSDIVLENTFFEDMIDIFEEDSTLGVASGGIYHQKNGRLVCAKINKSEPSGACLVIRKSCFMQCGGIFVSYAWESVLNTKAKLRNWNTRRYDDIVAVESRGTNSAEGYWKGYVYKGECAFFLQFYPLHVLTKSIMYLFKKPHFIGLAYLYGYTMNLILRKPQIDDEEIKNYYSHQRPKEISYNYISLFKRMLNKFK
ncbi:MAG: glycosyltransferase [Clostridia bacterium]|jgi:glycosyltransferase involved in cell wall biosynthesis|nr:glycosyltransferase [Clostridia bacterium]